VTEIVKTFSSSAFVFAADKLLLLLLFPTMARKQRLDVQQLKFSENISFFGPSFRKMFHQDTEP
jgi:hypothetical protein